MDAATPIAHKFDADSEMTFREVFDFAYRDLIPVLQGLARGLGQERFHEALRRAVSASALAAGQASAREVPANDFAAFAALARQTDRLEEHALTLQIVEDSPRAFAVVVTECLWATTFREMGAADLGYALLCHHDVADCRGFNPHIRLIRSQTLMQGDDCCDHRYVWEE